MTEFSIDFWTVVIGILCNLSCALLGCYLVLRRMSLLGDAISHAVLPGIVIAFVLFQSRASVPMFFGAMGVGVLTAFLTQTVHHFARVSQDTSMGVVFTTLFALGVVLLKVIPGMDNVHFDVDCVFAGNIEYEALHRVDVAGFLVPRTVLILGIVLVVNLAFMTLLWKELKLAMFDPSLSSSLGFSAGLIFYLLMAMVAGTTVATFWAVGSILVVAMLIVPGATAQLLTDRFGRMMIIAAMVGVVSSIGGYYFAERWDTSTAGMMAVVAGLQYGLALFFAPQYGIVSRWACHLNLAMRISREDILAAVYRWEEQSSGKAMPFSEVRKVAGGKLAYRAGVWFLKQRRHIVLLREGLHLSEPGKVLAASLIRSHRLWESYLAEHIGLPSDHLHEPAMRMEHFVTPEIEKELIRGLMNPKMDPHGRPIPEQTRSEKKPPNKSVEKS